MKAIFGGVLVLLTAFIIFFGLTPNGRETWNQWVYDVRKADDRTNYETKKVVEDTARAMISNYEADKITFEQYKSYCDTTQFNETKCDLALAAKLRANRTVSTYNNYILQNSFVWDGNIPSDINQELVLVE